MGLETLHTSLTQRPGLLLGDHRGYLTPVGASSGETPTQPGMFWAVIASTREASRTLPLKVQGFQAARLVGRL